MYDWVSGTAVVPHERCSTPDLSRLQGSHTQDLQIMYWDDRSTLDPQWYVNDSLSEGACVLYVGRDVRFENHFTNDIVIVVERNVFNLVFEINFLTTC